MLGLADFPCRRVFTYAIDVVSNEKKDKEYFVPEIGKGSRLRLNALNFVELKILKSDEDDTYSLSCLLNRND